MLFSPCISEWLPHPQHARGLEVVWFPGGCLGGGGGQSEVGKARKRREGEVGGGEKVVTL